MKESMLLTRNTVLFLTYVGVCFAQVQTQTQKAAAGLLVRDALPVQLKSALDVLGDRVTQSGKELVVSTGVFTKGKTQSTVRITRQMPNKLLFEVVSGASARSLGFDGQASWASDQLSDDDLGIADSLGGDTMESSLYSLQNGDSLRIVGEHLRADRSGAANYRGPWLDIFQSTGVAQQRSTKDQRNKLLVVDSNTRYLLYVRYTILRNAVPITVQTEWSDWHRVNGQAVPGRVVRLENGAEVWNFAENQAAIGAAQAVTAFQKK
jgi:hypothetical protein